MAECLEDPGAGRSRRRSRNAMAILASASSTNANRPLRLAIQSCPRDCCLPASQEWKSILPELRQLGVLSRIDGKALAAYCNCFARWMQAEREIKRLGIVVEEPITSYDRETGESEIIGYRYKKNPAVTISEGAMKLMKSFLVEFGMTPSSRSRLIVNEDATKPIDPAEKYFASNPIRPDQKIQ